MRKAITKEELEAARMRLYMVMMQHVGPSKKIGMGELFELVFPGETWTHRINDTRRLRDLVTEMRRDGQPVMSDSSATNGGYWIAASSSEVNEWCNRMTAKALSILKRISSIKKVSLPDYVGQLHLDLGGATPSRGVDHDAH